MPELPLCSDTPNLPQITLLKSTSPIEIDPEPSQESLNIAISFATNPTFQEIIQSIRRTLKVSDEGFGINSIVGSDLHSLPFYQNQLWKLITLSLVDNQLAKFNISNQFLDLLFLLTFYNAFIDPQQLIPVIGNLIDFVPTKKEISSKLFDYPQEVCAILLPFSVSKHAILEWIEQNWATIEESMDKSLEKAFPVFKISQNTSEGSIIDGMKMAGLSDKDISNQLTDLFPNDDRFKEESQIKLIHQRFLTQEKKISELLPQRSHISPSRTKKS